MTRYLKIFLLLAAGMPLQGCFPSFDQPVVELTVEARDERLLGLWEADAGYFKDMAKGDYGALLFLPCDAGYCITLYTVEEGRGDAIHMNGYAQIIDGTGYLNYQFYEVDPQEEGYHLAQYQILEDGSLALNLPDSGKLEKSIAAETFAGEVRQETEGDWSVKHIRVTSGRDELLAAFRTSDYFSGEPFGIFHPRADGMVEKVKKALWETSAGAGAAEKN